MASRRVVVINPLGLHARAAAKFVHAATAFGARVSVARGLRVMDGKSILGILLLSASKGTEITIEAVGDDEEEAVATLGRLVETGFGEVPWNA
jgi:phosphocarrier protein HPr